MEQNFAGTRTPRTVPMTALRRGDTFIVDLDLPGVVEDDVVLTVECNVVTIRGRRAPARQDGDEVIIDERPYGEFTRQLFGSNRKAERGSSDMSCDSPAEQPRQPEHPQSTPTRATPTRPAQLRKGEQPHLVRGGIGNVAQLKQAVLPWPAGQDVGQHDRDVVHRVPESVQDRYPDEPGDEPAGHHGPVAAAAGEQQRAGDRGPHGGSERGEQTPAAARC